MHSKLTNIICTIGPASFDEAIMRSLVDKGMNIARLNFSHGTRKQHKQVIETVRKVSDDADTCIGVLLDTKGAEVRTGDTPHPFKITEGEEVVFSPHPLEDQEHQVIAVNYDDFHLDVRETDRILIDSGELSFSIVDIRDDGSVLAKARESGQITSRRHINLPGADIDLPSITDKDWEDIAFGIENDIDYVALSFIRTAEEVASAKEFLRKHGSHAKAIAKIETNIAVQNMADIVREADGVMVARGDLGADVPLEEVPAIQDEIVSRCRDHRKPVIVATHMLESMIKHPVATRAELTDIAHAVSTGADGTMLSGETANGAYPQKAVAMMRKVITATEKRSARFASDVSHTIRSASEASAQAAVDLSIAVKAGCIIVVSTAEVAECISHARPHVPVFVFTDNLKEQRLLQLFFAAYPILGSPPSVEEATDIVKGILEKDGKSADQKVVIVEQISDTEEVLRVRVL